MNTPSQTSARLQQIESSLNVLASQQATWTESLRRHESKLGKLRPKYWYVLGASRIRTPLGGAQANVWRLGVLLCASSAVFTICFIACHLLLASVFYATMFGLASFIVALVVLSVALYLPESSKLNSWLETLKQEIDVATAGVEAANSQLDQIFLQVNQLEAEKLQLFSSVEFQRQQLFRENWKAMRGVEWESYLARVCECLGYHVELTRTTGDQGVDLVAQSGNHRVAIQAKGYVNSVGNAAIQQAVAGKSIYQCQFCAVITNSRFTSHAIELANANRCLLISEDNFHDFVMGRIPLHPVQVTNSHA